jgi:hypothetical protein
MPRGDGTGPATGGKGAGGGSGSWETGPGSGPGGNCVCTKCGKAVVHRRGIPCNKLTCPECGAAMTRDI